MNRIACASLASALIATAGSAEAVSNDNGDVLITQAAVNAGGITPGDTAGFPVTISLPGTYRLATNLTVTTAVNGIEVQANEVTIEMGGHTLAGSGIGRNGITSFNRSLSVQHGTVRGFTLDGIRTIGANLSVDRMLISSNTRSGVFEDGISGNVGFARITNSQVTQNGTGIKCDKGCFVQGSQIANSSNTGMYSMVNATVLDSIFAANVFPLSGYGIAAGDNYFVGNLYQTATLLTLSPNRCDTQLCPTPESQP